MVFVLVGPNQGKTMRIGSLGCHFNFVDGQCEVPDEAKDAHSLLQKFYGAHPAHLCKQMDDGKIVKIDEQAVEIPNFTKKPIPVEPQVFEKKKVATPPPAAEKK